MQKTPKRKSVLVTGASGFIGKALINALAVRGYDGIPFDREEGKDVLDRKLLKTTLSGADGVVHLGSPSSSLEYLKDKAGCWDNAIGGMVNLLELYTGRIVFPSTCTVYGQSEHPVKENQQLPEPPSPYAAAKIESERLCFLYNLKGADARIVRVFTGYGPEEWEKDYPSPVTHFIKKIYEGKQPRVYGDGTQVRDFVFIDDIVDCLIRVLETESREFIFNVGTQKGTSFIELIQSINKEMGVCSEPMFDNAPPPENYVQSIVADLSLTRRHLRYNPSITIEQGIKRTVEAYVETRRNQERKDYR